MGNSNLRKKKTSPLASLQTQHMNDSPRETAELHAALGRLLELKKASSFALLCDSDVGPLSSWWWWCIPDTWASVQVCKSMHRTKSALSSGALNALGCFPLKDHPLLPCAPYVGAVLLQRHVPSISRRSNANYSYLLHVFELGFARRNN